MSKTMTFEISQSDINRFNEELVRVVTVMQEQQRESEERWERITMLRDESEMIKNEIRKAREDVEKSLGAA
ncbi:MAG: hypothetical protein AB7P14_25410 [Blastocatellales bacterium]